MQKRESVSFSRSILGLVASFRGIPTASTQWKVMRPLLSIDAALAQCMHRLPSPNRISQIELIQAHWPSWIAPVDAKDCFPYRLDKGKVLWVRSANTILKQHMHFRERKLLVCLTAVLGNDQVKNIRWTL